MSIHKHVASINLDNYLALKAVNNPIFVSFTNDLLFLIADGNASEVSAPSWGLLPAGALRIVNVGEKIVFKAELSANVEEQVGIGTFSITRNSDNATCTLHGTVMSLLYGDNAEGQFNVPAYSFKSLFSGCDLITGVLNPNIFWGLAFTFGAYSCQFMFSGCNNLLIGPALEDHDGSASGCFYGMYSGCEKLVIANTTFSRSVGSLAYAMMFDGCSSLRLEVVLPATAINVGGYRAMFRGCSNVNNIDLSLNDIRNNSDIADMLVDTASTGTIKVSGTIKSKESTFRTLTGMPSGWTMTTT